ncbi:adenosylcobalamin-dependent ribonucleoside-diphosphate reductase [Candidatus Dojkabacteria bacterium]|uniref:Vitamin B12-dependent ribonucleotide reductase n=1 Tax=Candidatus Dojkabacteria bacterium TaxID=2099670 RepID=A0A955KZ52_9BACT|nr:adenosylcobalamin-dependent ribonucleoside-diphosphate reductase [Candidatus Dojkabacteria bacterium]
MSDPRPVLTKAALTERISENIGKKGLRIKRLFTKGMTDPYQGIKFEHRTSKIINPDGSVVFEKKDVEVPSTWSQVATDILAQKYFRKRDVPQTDENGKPVLGKDGKQVTGGENSAKQTMHRLANTWRWWGEQHGYFNRKTDADAFEDELKYMLMHQMVAPNSPQWFNTGLSHVYGITGSAQGHWYADPETGEAKLSEDAYTRQQIHACFIQGINDDLVNEGGILDLAIREARLFKYGSGTGSNFSNLRGKGEGLSGGGTSSGMMSFLNIFDAAAGSIKSGGTTRRAAKMVSVDIDHPEIEEFIEWKVIEEQKVASLVAGSFSIHAHLQKIMTAAETGGLDPEKNPQLKKLIRAAKDDFVPLSYIKRVLMMVENGVKAADFDFRTYDTDFRSEAYATVGGQNANNSVRVTNEFIKAVEQDGDWNLTNRLDGKVYKTVKARDLWDKITYAAWSSADPGLQYHTTINEWHTCPKDGEINASNPCSEYMFLDDTACNLASFNLTRFYDIETGEFDTEAFRHAIRLMTIVLEISVLMSHVPSKIVAERTYQYRTLGLGYANLGTMLMTKGVPYESEQGYAITAAITAILTGESYATSAEMAAAVGTFARYADNKDDMLRVIRNHRRAAYNTANNAYEGLTIYPLGLDSSRVDNNLVQAAQESWDAALELGEQYGYRNAQATCIAPTGTIGLVMDCDTTGIEPDFALVKFKKLVGGGYFKLVNQSVEPALRNLGYNEEQIGEIIRYAVGSQTLQNAPHINTDSLSEKGFTYSQISAIEAMIPGLYELRYAFTKWTLGEEFCQETLGLSASELNDPNLNILEKLGFTPEQTLEAENYICGKMTLEGAPHLKQSDYPVFDCANKCGKYGMRYISYMGHIKQMAAAQPFLSGAISKTINFPEDASFTDIADAYMQSWKLMTKANALYRDGSKLSQPLNTGSADAAMAKLFDFSSEEVADETINNQQLQQAIAIEQVKPLRRRLPDERHSITHKFNIAGHGGYITVGLYEDGTPGEIFISMNKEGSTLRGVMDALAVSMSWNLQYGVPLEELVRKFAHVRFEPAGMTTNREVPLVKSILDYIARWLALRFLDADTAKKYHNTELVDLSYQQGTNSRILIPIINGKGYTEIKHMQDLALEDPVMSTANLDLENINQKVATVHSKVTVAAKGKEIEVQAEKSMEYTTNDPEAIAKQQQLLATKSSTDDSETCADCGSVMVRQGSCYYCTSCGATTGCS